MNVGLTVNVADAMADLDTIDRVVESQTQQIVQRAATKLEARVTATTPIGKAKKRAGQRLSTGWVRRERMERGNPHIALANTRPHAHLAAEGFEHVGGKHVAAFVPWIADAVRVRGEMVDELGQMVDGGLPVSLRALEVTR